MRLKEKMIYALLWGCLLLAGKGEASCCNWLSDDCWLSDDLLSERRWSLTIRGGISPTLFLHRSALIILGPAPTDVVSSSAEDTSTSSVDSVSSSSVANPLFHKDKLPPFNRLFYIPWTIGFEVGYMVCCNVELFLDLGYAYSSGKSFNALVDEQQFIRSVSSYETYSGHLGMRYYFDWIEDFRVTPFVGFKVGITHHRGVTLRQTPVINPFQQNPEEIRIFLANNVLSGGVQLGTDFYLTDTMAINLNAELLVVGPIKSRQVVQEVAVEETFIFGRHAYILSYPITVGFKIFF